MNDMTQVIIPKSDQWNADDFIGGPLTFRIEGVDINLNSEQPVSIHLSGEKRVYRPCKSMSRCLVQGWGPDANKYVGKSFTLYRDATVKWGGMEVGGIRISHMSHIDGEKLMMLTATKGQRKPHKVKPLVDAPQPDQTQDGARKWADGYIAAVSKAETTEALAEFANSKAAKLAELESKRPELHAECVHALDNRRSALSFDDDFPLSDDNPTAAEGRAPEEFGDQFDGADEQQETAEETAQEDDAKPAWQATVEKVMADVRKCETLKAVNAVDAEWNKRRAAVSDESTVRAVDNAIDACRRELRAKG